MCGWVGVGGWLGVDKQENGHYDLREAGGRRKGSSDRWTISRVASGSNVLCGTPSLGVLRVEEMADDSADDEVTSRCMTNKVSKTGEGACAGVMYVAMEYAK